MNNSLKETILTQNMGTNPLKVIGHSYTGSVYESMDEYAKHVLIDALQWIEDNDIKNLSPRMTAQFYLDETK